MQEKLEKSLSGCIFMKEGNILLFSTAWPTMVKECVSWPLRHQMRHPAYHVHSCRSTKCEGLQKKVWGSLVPMAKQSRAYVRLLWLGMWYPNTWISGYLDIQAVLAIRYLDTKKVETSKYPFIQVSMISKYPCIQVSGYIKNWDIQLSMYPNIG